MKAKKTKKGFFFLFLFSALCFYGRSDRLLEHCSIALVGKYTKFSDSYASVIKALEHSALAISHKLEVKVGKTAQCNWFYSWVSVWFYLLKNSSSVYTIVSINLYLFFLFLSLVCWLCRFGAHYITGRAGEVPWGLAETLQCRVSNASKYNDSIYMADFTHFSIIYIYSA